jgi:hypothetical protein
LKTVIVACKTLKNELLFAMRKASITYHVEWMESGLHNVTDKLTVTLQGILDRIEAQRVLVVMGFCGNSIQGIKTGEHELIIPRVDDCISLLLGSVETRAEISDKYAAYFLTEGWMRGKRNLWAEYQETLEKYGEEQARCVSDMIYSNYRTLCLLDNGIDPIEPLVNKTKIIADTLRLEQKVISATTAYLEALLTGPWESSRFLIKAPGGSISAADLFY